MADYRIVPVSELDEKGLVQLAGLHHSVMHTLLSDLGLPILLKYYQVARDDSSVVGLCAVSPSGELLGWGMGSPHPEAINARLRKPLIWFMMQMLRVMLTRPMIFFQLVSSVLSSSNVPDMKKDSIELTYIGVDASQQGKGMGGELLHAFIEESRKAGYHSIELSVEVENEPAIALYKKNGFQITQTFSEGRYQRHRMELKL